MAEKKDYEIALCGDCTRRPIDPATGKPVEGTLRIGKRRLASGACAAVIYSLEDPRINSQYRVVEGEDVTAAIRVARSCGPIVQGMLSELSRDPLEDRIRRQNGPRVEKICATEAVLGVDASLPPDLLYQREPEVASEAATNAS